MTWEVLEEITTDSSWWDWLLTVVSFITNLVVLTVNLIKWMFMAVGRFAIQIFDWTFFNYINDIFNILSVYLWSAWATVFMGLFGLVFMILIYQFVFRLLRGRVNYDSTLKKYNKNHPSK